MSKKDEIREKLKNVICQYCRIRGYCSDLHRGDVRTCQEKALAGDWECEKLDIGELPDQILALFDEYRKLRPKLLGRIESVRKERELQEIITRWAEHTKVLPILREEDIPTLVGQILDTFLLGYSVLWAYGA